MRSPRDNPIKLKSANEMHAERGPQVIGDRRPLPSSTKSVLTEEITLKKILASSERGKILRAAFDQSWLRSFLTRHLPAPFIPRTITGPELVAAEIVAVRRDTRVQSRPAALQ